MKTKFKNQDIPSQVWKSRHGIIGNTFSYDTETTKIEQPDKIPDFIIATAYNDLCVYFIRKEDLNLFWEAHKHCQIIMHTAAFDIDVTTKACCFDFHPMLENGQIIDISILYCLNGLKKEGAVPHKYSLKKITEHLLDVQLDKDESIRLDFGRFLNNGKVQYTTIPEDYLRYATLDAVATYLSGQILIEECRDDAVFTPHLLLGTNGISALAEGEESLSDAVLIKSCRSDLLHTPHLYLGTIGTNGISTLTSGWGPLSHDIQLCGTMALHTIERNGLHVDQERVLKMEIQVAGEIEAAKRLLEKQGYIPGQKGNHAAYNSIIASIETRLGLKMPTTPSGKDKTQSESDLKPYADEPFVEAFLRYKKLEKLNKTFITRLKSTGSILHPKYRLLTNTGRTSCHDPNIQQLPRDGGIRECIIPSPGFVFIGCDYSAIELCTLAQVTFSRYGESRMRDLINEGIDLHRFTASEILTKPQEQVSSEERRKAKAVNFGIPGGMGAAGLVAYARETYGVKMTLTEGQMWRERWLSLFPEMQRYLGDTDNAARLAATLDMDEYPAPRMVPEIGAMILLRIAGGAKETTKGRAFTQPEFNWAWGQIAMSHAAKLPGFTQDIAGRKGSKQLQQAIIPRQTAITLTGRIRANCTYCESRNTPFQGLASDGAKLALYKLICNGFRVVAFIHDEIIIEVPEGSDYESLGAGLKNIMVEEMRRVVPDVTIRCGDAVPMTRWSKDAKLTYDGNGRIMPWNDVTKENKI